MTADPERSIASAASQINRPFPREGGWGKGKQLRGKAADNGNKQLPVAIVGGGPAGMSLALALSHHGIRSEIFDARHREDHRAEKRILALSQGSRQTLEWLGVWKEIDATPIAAIHVSQQGGLGRTLITAAEEGLQALGHVTQASSLIAALDNAVRQAGLIYREQTRVENVSADDETARLIVAGNTYDAALVAYAEGSVGQGADIKMRDYGQHAIVCLAATDKPHDNRAWERFTPQGPVALLPFGRQFAVVLTCPSATADRTAALDDAAFVAELQQKFGRRMRFVSVGPRGVFPLGLRYRRGTVGPRQVWLGNAAQTLHPVAGQGFNLALRDIRQLARAVADAADPGNAALLARHARSRRLDRRATIDATDGLVRLFSNDNPILRHARGIGLLALDAVPPARSFLARRMMFGARAWP